MPQQRQQMPRTSINFYSNRNSENNVNLSNLESLSTTHNTMPAQVGSYTLDDY